MGFQNSEIVTKDDEIGGTFERTNSSVWSKAHKCKRLTWNFMTLSTVSCSLTRLCSAIPWEFSEMSSKWQARRRGWNPGPTPTPERRRASPSRGRGWEPGTEATPGAGTEARGWQGKAGRGRSPRAWGWSPCKQGFLAAACISRRRSSASASPSPRSCGGRRMRRAGRGAARGTGRTASRGSACGMRRGRREATDGGV